MTHFFDVFIPKERQGMEVHYKTKESLLYKVEAKKDHDNSSAPRSKPDG